jgi:hypothetical protein
MNADHQGSAPSFEEDSGVLGVKKEINCVPIMPGLMQKGVYLSYTHMRPIYSTRWMLTGGRLSGGRINGVRHVCPPKVEASTSGSQ